MAEASMHKLYLLLALNVLLLSVWASSPPSLAISLRSLALLMLLTVPYVYRQWLTEFVQYWYKRNVIKGDSAFIHNLHITREEQILRLGKNEFSIAEPALLDTIYKDRTFIKSDQYAAFDVDGRATLFSMRDPIIHAQRHKAVAHLFKAQQVNNRDGLILDTARRFCKHIEDVIADDSVNILPFMRGFSVQTIAEFALGEPLCTPDAEARLGEHVALYIDTLSRSNRFGRSKAMLVRVCDHLFTALQIIGAQCRSLFAKSTIEQQPDVHEAFSVMNTFCARMSKTQGAPYRDHLHDLGSLDTKDLEAEVANLLFAGTDSTSVTLSLGLHAIYSNSRILNKLFQETRSLSPSDFRQNAYLNAVVDECLRLAQPVPRRLPRVVPFGKDIFYKEDKLDDGWEKIIPATATVGISAYTLHRNEAFRDALAFSPERWLPFPDHENKEALNYSSATERFRMRQCFVPFGKGVRACIGQELARQEVRTMIATFVQFFDGEADGPLPDCQDCFNASIKDGRVMFKLRKRST
jgi:cytochrome P450